MPVTPLPLSVVVISLNEEKRIGDCLASVADLAADCVVIDAHSSDRTVEIAVRHGARVFSRPWTGYSEQKNFGNRQARHDWILSLDADERVTPALARSIREVFAAGPQGDAFAIRFQNYFGPHCVRFGAWNPEWHVRLFDRRKLEWNTSDVHEGLCGPEDVRVARLRGTIRHLTVDSRAQLAEKTERYSSLFAANLRRRGRTPAWPKVWLNPAWRLGRDYVLRLGVLDGRAGAIIAWESARYTHLKYRKAQPTPRPELRMRLRGLNWAASLALLLLVMLRGPGPSENEPRGESSVSHMTELIRPALSTFALLDDDDNDDVFDVLPSDDDVLV